MKARDIFVKTLPFVWAKLLLWLVTVAVSAAWFAVLALIASAAKNSGVTIVVFILWCCGTGAARFILMRYFGYLVKAGHVAVIAEAVVTGRVPDNQMEFGKNAVKGRFATANAFFVVDRLVSGAVRQIQRVVGKLGGLLGFIPGMKSVTNLVQYFIEISLGYVDECCLGYTFYKKDQGAFKSAADGVVIFAQNWKKLLVNAAKTLVKSLLLMAVIAIAFALLFSAVFRLFNLGTIAGLAAFVLACIVAFAFKSAVMDSFVLTETMAEYMQLAPETVISYDLYEKLSGMSKKFKNLAGKAKEEGPFQPQPQAAYAGAAGGAQARFFDSGSPGAAQAAGGAQAGAGAAYCPACGTINKAGDKFCGNCGERL